MKQTGLTVADWLAAYSAFAAALAVGLTLEPRPYCVWIGTVLGGLLWLIWLCRSTPWQIACGITLGGLAALSLAGRHLAAFGPSRHAIGLAILSVSSWLMAGAAVNLLAHGRRSLGLASLTLAAPWVVPHALLSLALLPAG
jgi:hypothetical protein